ARARVGVLPEPRAPHARARTRVGVLQNVPAEEWAQRARAPGGSVSETLSTPVSFGASRAVVAADGGMRIVIPTDAERGEVELSARLHRPGVIRDALLALGDVLSSDLTRKPTDRADYLQYLISRGKGVSKQVWDAQKEYLALQYGVAAKHAEPLDPVVTITPDAVRFEVLSRDESTYAQLALR